MRYLDQTKIGVLLFGTLNFMCRNQETAICMFVICKDNPSKCLQNNVQQVHTLHKHQGEGYRPPQRNWDPKAPISVVYAIVTVFPMFSDYNPPLDRCTDLAIEVHNWPQNSTLPEENCITTVHLHLSFTDPIAKKWFESLCSRWQVQKKTR